MLSTERDQLAQEMKRTPELIQTALSDLQEKSESQNAQSFSTIYSDI